MPFGMYAIANDGGVWASHDAPPLSYVGRYFAYNRTGNESLFAVNTPSMPVVFVELPDGSAGSVLGVIGAAGNYTVIVLCDQPCAISVFVHAPGATSRFGLQLFDSAGRLTYDSSCKPLNCRKTAWFTDGSAAVLAPAGTNSVCCVGGGSQSAVTSSYRWEQVDAFTATNYEYICSNEYTCWDEMQWDSMLNIYVPRTVCGFKNVCRYQFVTHTVVVLAYIRRTDWSINRSTIRRNGSKFSFTWTSHQYGHYQEILNYSHTVISSVSSSGYSLPPGYTPPINNIWIYLYDYSGPYTADNTFPYTNSNYNMAPSHAMMINGGEYD